MTSAPVLVPLQFCSAIVLIFFLELAVAVLAFLFQDWVRDRFREFFESNIRSYRDDIDLQNLIDSLQKAVSTTFSLIELGFPGFSLCAWLGAQAGGEHWAFPSQLCPQPGGQGRCSPPTLVRLALSACGCWQARLALRVPSPICFGQAVQLHPRPPYPLPLQGPGLSSPGHAGSCSLLGAVCAEG